MLAQRRSGQRCIHGKRVISGHHTLGKLDQQRPYPQAREGVVRDLTRAGSRSDVKARGFKVRAKGNQVKILVSHITPLPPPPPPHPPTPSRPLRRFNSDRSRITL